MNVTYRECLQCREAQSSYPRVNEGSRHLEPKLSSLRLGLPLPLRILFSQLLFVQL